ncbi:MAG: hypothetical protein WC838_06495 [Candidatus Margulisiibacteriota bacterium]
MYNLKKTGGAKYLAAKIIATDLLHSSSVQATTQVSPTGVSSINCIPEPALEILLCTSMVEKRFAEIEPKLTIKRDQECQLAHLVNCIERKSFLGDLWDRRSIILNGFDPQKAKEHNYLGKGVWATWFSPDKAEMGFYDQGGYSYLFLKFKGSYVPDHQFYDILLPELEKVRDELVAKYSLSEQARKDLLPVLVKGFTASRAIDMYTVDDGSFCSADDFVFIKNWDSIVSILDQPFTEAQMSARSTSLDLKMQQ